MLEWIKTAIELTHNPATRRRLIGIRPTVLCVVQALQDSQRFLLIQPGTNPREGLSGGPADNIWMPPQEGIEVGESIETAVHRCLFDELGLDSRKIHFRKTAWVGNVLQPDRVGDRHLEQSLFRMRGKGYCAALVKADMNAEIVSNPTEVSAWGWMTVGEIGQALKSHHRPAKAAVIVAAFQKLLEIDLRAAS